jgi:hypothetical protein
LPRVKMEVAREECCSGAGAIGFGAALVERYNDNFKSGSKKFN